MRLVYADPPYLGCCALYGHDHSDGRCYDSVPAQQHLMEDLHRVYDGWAMSASGLSVETLDWWAWDR
jgi:hypothetical protein